MKKREEEEDDDDDDERKKKRKKREKKEKKEKNRMKSMNLARLPVAESRKKVNSPTILFMAFLLNSIGDKASYTRAFFGRKKETE